MLFAMKKVVHLLLPLVDVHAPVRSVVNQLAYLRRRRRIAQQAHNIVSIAYARAKVRVDKEMKSDAIRQTEALIRRLEMGEPSGVISYAGRVLYTPYIPSAEVFEKEQRAADAQARVQRFEEAIKAARAARTQAPPLKSVYPWSFVYLLLFPRKYDCTP
jgi:hypothetical protein